MFLMRFRLFACFGTHWRVAMGVAMFSIVCLSPACADEPPVPASMSRLFVTTDNVTYSGALFESIPFVPYRLKTGRVFPVSQQGYPSADHLPAVLATVRASFMAGLKEPFPIGPSSCFGPDGMQEDLWLVYRNGLVVRYSEQRGATYIAHMSLDWMHEHVKDIDLNAVAIDTATFDLDQVRQGGRTVASVLAHSCIHEDALRAAIGANVALLTSKRLPPEPATLPPPMLTLRSPMDPDDASQTTVTAWPTNELGHLMEGKVVTLVLLDKYGMVKNIGIDTSSGYYALDQVVLHAMQRWRFMPLLKDGAPVEGYVRQPVNLSLSAMSAESSR